MLKTRFPPFIFSFHVKSTSIKFGHSCRNISIQCLPTVRHNASTPLTPSYQLPPTSAYVHLPFCRKRCHYCDFPIVALGSSANQSYEYDPRIVDYVNLICREITATRLEFEQCPPLETVFFGGGTPSLVPPRLVSMVLDTLKEKIGICGDAEISMEMDPGTFGSDELMDLMGLGVNRVSLGVQAFQDELLKSCGRAHAVKEVYEAIEMVKSCDVKNWSIDLISSLPHQTPQMWNDSLQLTIDAQPSHISVYDLQLEEGTKFGRLYTQGVSPLPSETQSAEFYKMASKALSDASYVHYEISSYCKGGFQCKHNTTYWEDKSFYAFGLGSASYVNGVRFSRPKRMKGYVSYVRDLEDGVMNQHENGDIGFKDRAMDMVMLSLRTARGLDIQSFSQTFGNSIAASLCQAYEPYVESGHVVCLDKERNIVAADRFKSLVVDGGKTEEALAFIRLSDPDGFLLSNELISIAFRVIAP